MPVSRESARAEYLTFCWNVASSEHSSRLAVPERADEREISERLRAYDIQDSVAVVSDDGRVWPALPIARTRSAEECGGCYVSMSQKTFLFLDHFEIIRLCFHHSGGWEGLVALRLSLQNE